MIKPSVICEQLIDRQSGIWIFEQCLLNDGAPQARRFIEVLKWDVELDVVTQCDV